MLEEATHPHIFALILEGPESVSFNSWHDDSINQSETGMNMMNLSDDDP